MTDRMSEYERLRGALLLPSRNHTPDSHAARATTALDAFVAALIRDAERLDTLERLAGNDPFFARLDSDGVAIMCPEPGQFSIANVDGVFVGADYSGGPTLRDAIDSLGRAQEEG